jgi:nucleoside-diphosphate-sugar epimerase
VLGGTRFVGRAIVMDALFRKWNVTVVNRGVSGTLPPEVEQVTVDRTDFAALAAALEGRSFGMAIDTWAGGPDVVQAAADLLVGKTDRFGYVSSISVYAPGRPPGGDESWDAVPADPSAGSTDYATDKRGGELAALAAFPDAVLARAGMILGPWENIGRLPWWLGRMARGGRVVAPGRPDRPWQFVDVRDLAAWMNAAVATHAQGPFDLTCPSGHVTTRSFLEAVRDTTGGKAELVWVDQETVLASGAQPWVQLPGWVPEGGEFDGFMEGDTTAAINTGLLSRPVEETVADTWTWLQDEGEPDYGPAGNRHGLPEDIERALVGD